MDEIEAAPGASLELPTVKTAFENWAKKHRIPKASTYGLAGHLVRHFGLDPIDRTGGQRGNTRLLRGVRLRNAQVLDFHQR